MSVVDAMTTVDNASATSVSELNTGLQKSASSAKEAGVPLQKLISYIGEMSSVTRLPASTIGTGLNSIFSRFSSIKMGKNYDENSGEEISLNNVEKSLKTVGIAIRSDKDTFKSFSDVLDQVGNKWGNFTDRQKNLISTQLAG
jgi:TP901 family phage tail tape measure protein